MSLLLQQLLLVERGHDDADAVLVASSVGRHLYGTSLTSELKEREKPVERRTYVYAGNLHFYYLTAGGGDRRELLCTFFTMHLSPSFVAVAT